MIITRQELELVDEDSYRRHQQGAEKYGELNPDTDKRDFLLEAEQELLDLLNYTRYRIIQLRRLRGKLEPQRGDLCPDCKEPLRHWGGCVECPICGHSKCG